MKTWGFILFLLTLLIAPLASFSAEAAMVRSRPAIKEIFTGGYFGGIKRGILILNLSKQGHTKTYYAPSNFKASCGGTDVEIHNLPINTEIRVTTDLSGSITKIVCSGGGK